MMATKVEEITKIILTLQSFRFKDIIKWKNKDNCQKILVLMKPNLEQIVNLVIHLFLENNFSKIAF